MSKHETRLSRRETERLLDAPATHDSALGWVLSAASAPAHPTELRREDSTAAAFHSARLSPPPARRRAFVSPTRLGSRAAVHAVVATGAVVAMASGGFALAGSLDLPSLPGQASDRATEAVLKTRGATGATETKSSSTGRPSGTAGGAASGTPTKAPKPTKSPSATAGEATDDPTASPTPNLTGLCTAFQATDRSDNGTSLDSAAFTALAAAAGGADQIATYCVGLIGAPETGKPADKPSPTGKPTPTDKPTPTNKPTDTPTGSPTNKPSTGTSTDRPEQSGKGGGKDSTTSGS